MKAAELHRICLGLPGVREEFPFDEGSSVFKVAGKMFALCPLKSRPLRINLKCDPDLAVQLRLEYPAITAGYHMNKRHWNTVVVDGSVPDRLVREMVEDSYDLVVAGLPKREQEKLNWIALARE
ncbi:MmcQ/YjbR family DNA-binding protein [Amycolatopsis sp. GM8]|uniref:MmcQ/YjbR family DNA-binding protein n=1 Tax=Amycolatopsis sp. GM8 TaxID=2896530 RepID=UPI001F2C12FF|nr:MmcQ/YjbR family DNA-binding protein [Amycolatopsis sp. GM8]